MKIVIFHYHWFMQIHTVFLAEELARKGHDVTIAHLGHISDYTYLAKNIFVKLKKHVLSSKTHFLLKCIRKALSLLNCTHIFERLFSATCAKQDKKIIKNILQHEYADYDLSIGVEKGGLLCSGLLHDIATIPYIYYSLEIVSIEDCPKSNFALQILSKIEPGLHQKALATIVQDEDRAAALLEYNKVKHENILLLPVGVYKTSSREHVDKKNKFCLLFGLPNLAEEEVIQISRALPNDYTVIFQGVFIEQYEKILSKNSISNIVLQKNALDDLELERLIEKSKICLAIYTGNDKNHQLIAFSSEKTARYLQSGVPFISKCPNGNFEKLFNKYKCGIKIDNFSQLNLAIQHIENSYDDYSKAAYAAFDNIYDYKNNFEKMYNIMLGKKILY